MFEEEVDFLALDGGVDAGLGEAVVVAEPAEEDLQAAAGEVGARVVGFKVVRSLWAPRWPGWPRARAAREG